jgi:hypothetical protein
MIYEGITKLATGSSVRAIGKRAIPSLRYASSSTPNQPDASSSKSRTTHFGFREIPEEDKETMGMFTA